jgi:hypothetical protein
MSKSIINIPLQLSSFVSGPLSFTAYIGILRGQESSVTRVLYDSSNPLRWRVLRPLRLLCSTIYLQAPQSTPPQLRQWCLRLVKALVHPTEQHRKPNTSSLGGGAPNIHPRYGHSIRKSSTSLSDVAMHSYSHGDQLTSIPSQPVHK